MPHFLAGAALLALALLAAVSWGSAPAQAGFPGQNGRIACQGLRGPAPAPAGVSREEIFSVNPDGSDERVLSNNSTLDRDPAFSPDGTKIAFAAQRDNVAGQPANTEIYVANNDGDLEGPDVKRLTFNDGTLASGSKSGVAATDAQPSWSPDGTQIVFHSGRDTTFPDGTDRLNRFEIYRMSSTEGERGSFARLTNNRVQDAIPDWSPDGTKIVFQSLREGSAERNNNLEIFTMNPDGTEATNVSNNPGTPNNPVTPENENTNGQDRDPDWSPDSSQIAYTSTRDNVVPGNQNFEIYKSNRDGSSQRRLTLNLSGDTPEGQPYRDHDDAAAWSPDGTRIVFSSSRTSETNDGESVTAFTMDSQAGEAAGLQAVGEVSSPFVFPKCDWQSVRPAQTPTTPTPSPGGSPVAPFVGCPAASSASAIRGTAADNRITGTGRADRIVAAGGNDVVDALAGNDCVDLGTGADRGEGGTGNDLMAGGRGNDRVSGSSGNDRLSGGPDNDRLTPGRGNDRAFGDSGNDLILGSFGNDVLHGVDGNDRISGSRGRDRINGGSGRDVIAGGSSDDRLLGDRGNDRINGNSGNDRIEGNSGNDRITSRDGRRDRVSCGSGRDSVLADRIDRVARNCERVRRR